MRSDGDLLIDARNTWAAYDVDARSGQVRWQLGGKRSSFAMGPGTRTAWQHDAREQPDGTITFFDNGATPAVHAQSRAIDVRLDPQRMTATLVRERRHPGKALVAGSQGNVQALADGALDGRLGRGAVRLRIQRRRAGCCSTRTCPRTYESYRAYRLPWSGATDATRPRSPSCARRRPRRDRLRELERRDAASPPGACSRAPRRALSAPAGERRGGGFETARRRCPAPAPAATCRCRRSTPRAPSSASRASKRV